MLCWMLYLLYKLVFDSFSRNLNFILFAGIETGDWCTYWLVTIFLYFYNQMVDFFFIICFSAQKTDVVCIHVGKVIVSRRT